MAAAGVVAVEVTVADPPFWALLLFENGASALPGCSPSSPAGSIGSAALSSG